MESLTIVIDESGRSSRPGADTASDFALGAIAFPASRLVALRAAEASIRGTVRKSDFKYKHVAEDRNARELFITLARSVSTFAYYVAGAALIREAERVGRATASEPSMHPSREEIFARVVRMTAIAIGYYAAGRNRETTVYWDRRTDMDFVAREWKEGLIHVSRRDAPTAERLVRFAGTVIRELNPVARLSGVLAGDIVEFFRRHGARYWGKLDRAGLSGRPRLIHPTYNELPQPVGMVPGPLADADFLEPSCCMLQGYYTSLIQRLLSFADPDGRFGLLCPSPSGEKVLILQVPD